MAQESKMGHRLELAKPLHLQQLERGLDVEPFISYAEQIFKTNLSDDDDDSSDSESDVQNNDIDHTKGKKIINGISTTKDERQSDKMRLYNFDNVKKDRRWLKTILISDSSGSSSDSEEQEEDIVTEQDLQDMLKFHLLKKKYQQKYYNNPENAQYQYYGTGLLSNYDKFPEHQKLIVGSKKKKKEKKSEKKNKKSKKPSKEKSRNDENSSSFMPAPPSNPKTTVKSPTSPQHLDHDLDDYEFEEKLRNIKEEDDPDNIMAPPSSSNSNTSQKFRPNKRRSQPNKNPEVMTIRRRKIWMMMAKKELGKVQRARLNNHKEMLTNTKRMATLCMKFWRQKAMQSQKNMKEVIWRSKRLTREMQSYWKRYDRVERETRRRQEKEAEEQRKLDGEMMEAKRQQRKLNFLITQTELYAHFMSKKLGKANQEEQLRILRHLEEEKIPRLATIDDYDSEKMKEQAQRNVKLAIKDEDSRTQQYRHSQELVGDFKLTETSISCEDERPQPKLFKGTLKHYQLKGVNWLANLYDQGINGILADEMGLGKTVQSIAFLCHIAEKYDTWGPFLIISPASTLHNWQQEMARFVPDFKIVPYWGSPQERKILRQFWDIKNLHTKDASFHVVITSYQLVITDIKYFNRIKWQYLVLDEAQALKSTSSVRWKLLLGFSCRNRLLLSGTPIQNSMAELWALLHFIMPTLFDSHDEFNEWFSKDIESHAENKTGIDEKHLSRLHMILKPFMLRRIKKDVENELSDKIEVMVYCPLTRRQQLLYAALKKKIRIEDLLYSGSQSSQSVTSSLMNLVMQFRKVCNHPELFERREPKSPWYMKPPDYIMPQLIFEEGFNDRGFDTLAHILYNKFSIFDTEYIHRSLFPLNNQTDTASECFAFSRFFNLTAGTLSAVSRQNFIHLLCYFVYDFLHQYIVRHLDVFHGDETLSETTRGTFWKTRHFLQLACRKPLSPWSTGTNSPILSGLVFVRARPLVYTHITRIHHSIPETLEHRILRSRRIVSKIKIEPSSPTKIINEEQSSVLLYEFEHKPRPPTHYPLEPAEMPPFVYSTIVPKVQSNGRNIYATNRSAAWYSYLYVAPRVAIHILEEICENNGNLPTDREHYQEEIQVRPRKPVYFLPQRSRSFDSIFPTFASSNIIIPDKHSLVTDAGKLFVLDGLLRRLKEGGHRVLIYSQMTRMIDLLEEYMWHRKHTYMRLDGSSKISERRDMVADFQSREDIFVFLLSTRAGGLGINLTAADTVIFYDSDWNPTVDQQAMDRAHRLGQTKQVTVYRLICKGSIEERILQRAREKSEIQRMVISGGNFKPDTLKPKEVVSLLLDDEEIEKKYRQRQAEKRVEDPKEKDRKRKQMPTASSGTPKAAALTYAASSQSSTSKSEGLGLAGPVAKKSRLDDPPDDSFPNLDSGQASPASEVSLGSGAQTNTIHDETSNEGLIVDVDTPSQPQSYPLPFASNMLVTGRPRPGGRGAKRGRPRGSRRPTNTLARGIPPIGPSTSAAVRQVSSGTGAATQQLAASTAVMAIRNEGRMHADPLLGNQGRMRADPLLGNQDDPQKNSTPSPDSSLPGPSTSSSLPLSPSAAGPSTSSAVVPGTSSGSSGGMPLKRGPGRPRLRPSGPGHQVIRGPPRPRKAPRPLPVPLGHTGQSTSPGSSTTPKDKPFGFYTQSATSDD